jgi:hypothetical protein
MDESSNGEKWKFVYNFWSENLKKSSRHRCSLGEQAVKGLNGFS